jgi:hypothetical protein
MNRVAALLLMVLVSPCGLIGQSVSPQAGVADGAPGIHLGNVHFDASTFSRQPNVSPGSNCPVELRAQPAGGGSMAYANGPQKDMAYSPRVHLIFGNRKSREIVGVSVTIRGLGAWARVVPVDGGSKDSHQMAKTVDMKLNVATGKNGEGDVTLKSFAAITRVDVESVEYADRTSWKASAMQSCHIVPDLFMLIGSH